MVQEYAITDNLQLSKNFRLGEFACKCGRCKKTLIDDVLVAQLQAIRNHFGVSVNITSGYRCASQNAAVGGDPRSSHMQGMAADIVVSGIKPRSVAKFAESMGIVRVGLYDDFVHIGSGATKRFWLGHEGRNVQTHDGEPIISMTLPVLRRGSRGDAVKALQVQLGIKADGSFGPATEAAVKKYQTEHALPPHGIVDSPTVLALLGTAKT